jgi:HAMP domain-containing protein
MSTVIGSRRWLRAGRRRRAQLGLRRVAIALPVAARLAVVGINDYVVAGRLLIPVSAILDLRADLAGHDLAEEIRDAIWTYSQALAGSFRQAASWVRSGEGADAVSGGLPQPPALSGPGDHLAALAAWYRLLHEDICEVLDEVGPQPQPVIAPPVGHALHAAG